MNPDPITIPRVMLLRVIDGLKNAGYISRARDLAALLNPNPESEVKALEPPSPTPQELELIQLIKAARYGLTEEQCNLASLLAQHRSARVKELEDALEPVRLIVATEPATASRADTFERGCPLTPAQIRKMQHALNPPTQ